MKALSRVILVNWYLFEAEEWKIEGHVALLGKNGSGKSSFIDAMQLLLLGGNKKDWKSNAKATHKQAQRDIRSYVLGLVKDEEAVANATQYQPREDALSRIVLVFNDTETNEKTTIGVAISARRDDPDENIEGFFILRGHGIRLDDLLYTENNQQFVKPYDDVKALFKDKVKRSPTNTVEDPDLHLFGHEPKQYVEQMLRTLGAKQQPPESNKFRRAFKQSIKLSGLEGTVSEFVRSSILDSSQINLDMMKQSIESLENKKAAVLRANQQIKSLEKTEKQFEKARLASKRKIANRWCAKEFAFSANDIRLDEATDKLVELLTKHRESKRALSQSQKAYAKTRKALNELTVIINSDEPELNKERLNALRKIKSSELSRVDEDINKFRDALQYATEVSGYLDAIDSDTQVIEKLTMASERDVLTQWPPNATAIDNLTKDAEIEITSIRDNADAEKSKIIYETGIVRNELDEYNQQLNRLMSGQSVLKPSTLALINVLEDKGIKATPLCELVEVTDPEWAPAIEAFLRGNTEALIVPTEDCDDAIRIYRSLKGRMQIGAVIVNSQKVNNWTDTPKPGSAAHIITGENAIAVAYIQRLLRGIELHKDTKALKAAKRAIAPDGSFNRTGGFTRLHLPKFTILGRGAVKSQIAYIDNEINTLIGRLSSLDAKTTKLNGLWSSTNRLLDKLSSCQTPLSTLTKKKEGLLIQVNDLQTQINAIDTSHLDELKAQKEVLELQVERLDKEKNDLVSTKTSTRMNFRTVNAKRRVMKANISVFNSERNEITSHDDYDASIADEIYEKVENEDEPETTDDYDRLIDKVSKRCDLQHKAQMEAEDKAKSLFVEYRINYPNDIENIELNTIRSYRLAIATRLQDIREIGLQDREKEVTAALKHLEHVIRSDLSIRLRGQFEMMQRRFRELNNELRNRPFSSNQRYEFRYYRMREFKEFLDYVEHIDNDSVANIDSLFDENSSINEVIKRILDDNESETLGDYRNYFTFDIAIKDPDSGIEEMLSRKVGHASGGEHMTPFYVAMGASLAGAYRLKNREDGGIDGGMSLYLADEAFEKMDYANSTQSAGYLKSIGLQLFLAAPDSSEAKLRSIVDTVMFFIREGERAKVEVDYMTPSARKLLTEAFVANKEDETENA